MEIDLVPRFSPCEGPSREVLPIELVIASTWIWFTFLCLDKRVGCKAITIIVVKTKGTLGYQIRMWEYPWIPTIPARPARPAVHVVHPRMTTSDFIHGSPRVWNVALLEQFVEKEDIPLTRSLAIRQSHRDDKYYWGYTKSGLYTVKLGYWVARNVLNQNSEVTVSEPSTTKLQAYVWKINTPQKMHPLIWKMVLGY